MIIPPIKYIPGFLVWYFFLLDCILLVCYYLNMAKVTAPLISISARGSVGGSLVFIRAKGGHSARRWAKPRYTRNNEQNAMRLLMSDASTAWRTNQGIIDSDYKNYYAESAKWLNMSGFNLYIKYAIKYNNGSNFTRPFIIPPIPGQLPKDWSLPYVFGD